MMKNFVLLSFTAVTAEEHVSLLQTAALKKHQYTHVEETGDIFRAACENPGHPTFRACTLGRTGTCYGKVQMKNGGRASAWKDVQGQFGCNNGFFGGDPAPGVAKECVCDGTSTPPPDNSFRVACENPGHATFRECNMGRTGVCYGKAQLRNGGRRSAWKDVSGEFACNNGFFGGDPAPGVAKECVCDGSREAPEGPYEHRVACEHVGHGTYRDCTMQRTGVCYGKVKFGHAPSNRWSGWKTTSGSFSCVGGTFGGDPAPHQAKECICMGTDSPQCPSEFRAACENPGHGSFRDCTSGRTGTCFGQVKLGHGSRWSAWKSVSGQFGCNNGFFGADPAPGQAKECVCKGCDEATTTTTTAALATTTEEEVITTTAEVTTTTAAATTTRPDKEYCDLCAISGGTLNLDADKKCQKWGSFTPGSAKCEKFQNKKAVAKKCCGIIKVKPTKAPKVDCNVCAAGDFNPDGLDGRCKNHLKAQGDKCTQKQNDDRIQARCCV